MYKVHVQQTGNNVIVVSWPIPVDRGAMKSFKGGMQDRNLGPLLPDYFFFLLTFNKKLRETE